MKVEEEGLTLWLPARRDEGRQDVDLAPFIAETIREAQAEVYLATQQLEDRTIVDELIAADRRGCRVQVIVERDYLTERTALERPWHAGGDHESNRQALAALLRSKVDVRIERRSTLLHENYVVRDPDRSSAAVVLSSANFDAGGLRRHYDGVFQVHDATTARAFTNEFHLAWEDQSTTELTPPPEVVVGGIRIKSVFGPRHQPEMEIMKQLAKSRQKVRFAVYTFSSSSGIDDVMSAISSSGQSQLRGVLDRRQQNQWWVASHGLSEAGVAIAWLGDEQRKLHHKMITIDDQVLVFGTYNFSASARRAQEALFVVGGPSPSAAERRLVEAVTVEIERLFAVGAAV